MLENGLIILDISAFRLSEENFFQFCHDNDLLRIERTENQQLIIKSLRSTRLGWMNVEINFQLANWNKQDKSGKVFDSSTGFTLADQSVRSPDASWVSNEQWDVLSESEKNKFAPVCPEFVIELKSYNDHIDYLKEKMLNTWIKNGCQLAWLIDPDQKVVYVYTQEGLHETLQGFQRQLSAGQVLPNFELDFTRLEEE